MRLDSKKPWKNFKGIKESIDRDRYIHDLKGVYNFRSVNTSKLIKIDLKNIIYDFVTLERWLRG